MNEYLFIVVFVLWYIGSLIISEKMGDKSKLGVEGSFLACMLVSPILGFVLTYFVKK